MIFLLCHCNKDNNDPVDICSGFINAVYKYPHFVCTDSTDCFQKHKESLLLPEQYLECSSTDSLSRTCLDYPLLGIIWAYNSLQQGFDYILEMFNGFDELFDRDDANSELIKLYQQMDPDSVSSISEPVDRGEFMAQFTFIEITIAQYQLINKLTREEVTILLSACLEKYYWKSDSESFGWIGEMSTLAIIARILKSINYEPFINEISEDPYLEYYISVAGDGLTFYQQMIITCSENYLAEQKSYEGGYRLPATGDRSYQPKLSECGATGPGAGPAGLIRYAL